MTNEDCRSLILECLKGREDTAKQTRCTNLESHIFCDTIVVSDILMTKLSITIEELMPSKAKEAIAKGAIKHQLSSGKSKIDMEEVSSKNKKEERRKKATGGKAGGGAQGRETKTKSTKSKRGGKKHDAKGADSDDDQDQDSKVEFLSLEELRDHIAQYPILNESTEELIDELAEYFMEPSTNKFQKVAFEIFASSMSSSGDDRKKNHQTLQEKVFLLLTTVKLAEKGLKVLQSV